MSWIPKKNSTASSAPAATVQTATAAPAPARTQGKSLEMPVVISARRLPAPVYGTLMDVNAHGATVRSLVMLERGTDVEFDLSIGGHAAITVTGRVESRRNAAVGARFEHQISFATMNEAQIDSVARVVRDLELRAAAARSMRHSIDSIPTTDRERRGSYRALSAFPARFRLEEEDWADGKVGDISATGIRLLCPQLLEIGSAIEMRITLPSVVLDVYPEETTALDVRNGTARRLSGRPDMRRPFEEMVLRGRVVTRFQPLRDHEVHGVAFIEIDGYQREEIARFTHAVQLGKIRK